VSFSKSGNVKRLTTTNIALSSLQFDYRTRFGQFMHKCVENNETAVHNREE
jgi:hypothetical protein